MTANSELNYSEGIAESYRQLRKAVKSLLAETGDLRAHGQFEASLNILQVLTGRSSKELLEATLRRIAKDIDLGGEGSTDE